MIGKLIGGRLAQLRKHLGERKGEELTLQEVSSKTGLTSQQIYRLERGLKGNTEALIGLLLYYRSNGYNLEWIITPENHHMPLLVNPGSELFRVGEQIRQLGQLLTAGYESINAELSKLGYKPLDEKLFSPAGAPDPLGV